MQYRYIFTLLSLFLLLGTLNVNAQTTISGLVIDGEADEPLPYATVAVLNTSDSSMVAGAATENDGRFEIRNISEGTYLLRIAYVGYAAVFISDLNVHPGQQKLELDQIPIYASSAQIGEVVISAERDLFEFSGDKRIYNVSQDITSVGGTATDVMENVPSVTVDNDGNISLRGSEDVIVYINGRPSGLSGSDQAAMLEQIPASSIERIEVITNPSARYDAEGVSGIINIQLKRDQRRGFNGQVSAGASTSPGANGALNLNYRTPDFNLFTNYSFRYSERGSSGTTYRERETNEGTFIMDQSQTGENIRQVHMINSGAEYFINDKNTISLTTSLNLNTRDRDNNINLTNLFEGDSVINRYERETFRTDDGYSFDANLDYIRNFKTDNRRFSILTNFSISDRDRIEDFFEYGFENNGDLQSEARIIEESQRDRINQVISAQADYQHPLGENAFFETGLRTSYRLIDNEQRFYRGDEKSFDPDRSNRFEYSELVHAAYGIYGSEIGDFNYQLGLRGEYTDFTGNQITMDETFGDSYFQLFPSVNLNYNLEEGDMVSLNYSRRINRPSIWRLNPFIDYSDPLNLRSGNPELRPELTNSYELVYDKRWDNIFVTTTAYYRRTNDVIYRSILVDSTNVSRVTHENFNWRDSYGLEFITRFNLYRWWNVTSTLNIYRSEIDGRNIEETFSNQDYAWSIRLMSSMNIPNIAQVQLTGHYNAARVLAQGEMQPMYGVNIGLRRDVLDDKGTISINASDIFNTRRFAMEAYGADFKQNFERKWTSRVITASFTYRFGNLRDERRRPDRDRRQHNGEEPDMDFF